MKILFTDLDDTLLNNQSEVSEYTKEVILRMLECGHRLVLSSGRPLGSVMEVAKKADLFIPGVYLSSNNGSCIYEIASDNIIYEKTVPMDYVKAVWELGKSAGIHIQTYSNTSIYSPALDDEIEFYTRKIHLPVVVSERPWEELEREPYKLLAVSLNDRDKLEVLRNTILDRFSDKLDAIFSSDRYLEIFNCTSGKGEGLKWLCNHLDIDIKDSYAAGDAMNDLSMIEAAGNGIVMCNGVGALFPYAQIITKKSNDEDGLAEVIKEHILG